MKVGRFMPRARRARLSAGVAMVMDGDDAKTFLTRADSALYAAKAGGRNCVFCHNGEDTFPGQSQDLTAVAPTPAERQPAPKAATIGRAEAPK